MISLSTETIKPPWCVGSTSCGPGTGCLAWGWGDSESRGGARSWRSAPPSCWLSSSKVLFLFFFFQKNLPAVQEFNPWVGKIPWRRKWQPTPVSLSGKSHGQRSLVGDRPWGRKESGTIERLTLTHSWFTEEGTATHCSTLACWIPWTEEPGRLQSVG